MKRKDQGSLHEGFERETAVSGSTNKNFGLVFAAFFGLLGLLPLLKGAPPKYTLLAIAGTFSFFAFVLPKALGPLNFVWTRFGLLLHKIISPLVMGILFYGVVTPVGQLMRLCGTDPMKRKWDTNTESYWVTRTETPEQMASMQNQF